MMMRQTLCVCLLLSIFTGCGKQPPLGLPTSDWKVSKPITGYQWYIDGKASEEHGDIDKSRRIILTGVTTDRHDFINWTLQVAPGKNNIVATGRITIDPKNLPKLDWPPSGSLAIDNSKSILRIEQYGSDGSISNVRELFIYSEPLLNTEQVNSSD